METTRTVLKQEIDFGTTDGFGLEGKMKRQYVVPIENGQVFFSLRHFVAGAMLLQFYATPEFKEVIAPPVGLDISCVGPRSSEHVLPEANNGFVIGCTEHCAVFMNHKFVFEIYPEHRHIICFSPPSIKEPAIVSNSSMTQPPHPQLTWQLVREYIRESPFQNDHQMAYAYSIGDPRNPFGPPLTVNQPIMTPFSSHPQNQAPTVGVPPGNPNPFAPQPSSCPFNGPFSQITCVNPGAATTQQHPAPPPNPFPQ
jgi:hypothetical protein